MKTFLHSYVLRPLRVLLIVFTCTVLFTFSAVPALAAGTTTPSKPSEGETQLKKVYDESEKSLNSGLDSMKEVSQRAQRGINEVQADADLNKMNTPENSQDATTFKDQIEKVLEKVTPGN